MFLKSVIFAILTISSTISPSQHNSELSTKEPFHYGFIHTNVTCNRNGNDIRIKYVSEIFQWCPFDSKSRESIVDDSLYLLNQRIRVTCGNTYEITINFLDSSTKQEDAKQSHTEALNNTGYSEHYEWRLAPAYYSSNCR